ncbi:MAG: hypothetical protein AAFP17_11245 [Pseudomonadota bacterium]
MKREQGTPEREEDRALDALLRTAAASDADEAATRQAVMARLAEPQGTARWFEWLPPLDARTAGAAFAVLMLSAGLGGYALPDLLGGVVEDWQLLNLASGSTAAIEGSFGLGGGRG